MWLVADDFDKAKNTWKNRGSGQDVTNLVRSHHAEKVTKSGHGSKAEITSVQGTRDTGLDFGKVPITSNNFAMCSLTRYNGGSKGRILLGGGNWLWGHWASRTGVSHTQHWTTGHGHNGNINQMDWLVFCGSNRKHFASSKTGTIISVGNNNDIRQPNHQSMAINFGCSHCCCTGERSDFQIAELIIWNKVLSESDLKQAAEYLLDVLKNGRRSSAAWLGKTCSS